MPFRPFRLLVLLVVAALGACSHVFTLDYTADELNGKLQPLFPLQQKQGPFTINLTQPKVRFNSPANRLGIAFDLDVQGMGLKLQGSTVLEGKVEYRSAARAFYVVDPVVSELNVKGVPSLVMTPLRQAISFAGGLALKDRPIYTLNPALSREALAIAHLRGIRVADDRLQISVSLSRE